MKQNINLASTESLTKAQLNRIVSGIVEAAQKKSAIAKKKLDKEIEKEIKNAAARFKK